MIKMPEVISHNESKALIGRGDYPTPPASQGLAHFFQATFSVDPK